MSNVFAFLGAQEVVVILVIALLIFGPNKLPEIGRQIAMGLREMRRMSGEVQRALDLHDDDYRYGSSHYGTSGGTAGSENDAYGGEPLANTRPWSVVESPERNEHDLLAAQVDGPAETPLAPPVTTVEPPGPPVASGRQPSETSPA